MVQQLPNGHPTGTPDMYKPRDNVGKLKKRSGTILVEVCTSRYVVEYSKSTVEYSTGPDSTQETSISPEPRYLYTDSLTRNARFLYPLFSH